MILLASGGGIGSGLIAFLVVLVLGVAAYFLFRSMNRHLRKVPDEFSSQPESERPNGQGPVGEQ